MYVCNKERICGVNSEVAIDLLEYHHVCNIYL